MSPKIPHLIRWNSLLLQGRRRRQEDAIRAELPVDDRLVFALADGLGGHSRGNDASRTAVDEAVRLLIAREPFTAPDAPGWRLLFQDVHHAVRALPDPREAFGAPAATLIAGHLYCTGTCSLAAVGDSSAWLIQADGTVARLFGSYGSGSLVPSPVGDRTFHKSAVEHMALTLQPGDRLVLASDGIESLPEARIEEILRLPFDQVLPELSTAIVQQADEHQDNLAVLVIDLLDCDVG